MRNVPRNRRLGSISVAHVYNLRASAGYRAQRVVLTKTRPAKSAAIGVRKAPAPQGRAGFRRIPSPRHAQYTAAVYNGSTRFASPISDRPRLIPELEKTAQQGRPRAS
jgi:hypothetical protein